MTYRLKNPDDENHHSFIRLLYLTLPNASAFKARYEHVVDKWNSRFVLSAVIAHLHGGGVVNRGSAVLFPVNLVSLILN